MPKDYYETLGIPRTADAAEIKKAYHKLAMKHHPDRNKGQADAESKFKEINEAYEVLSDPQKKSQFDQYGSAGDQFDQGFARGQHSSNFGGFGFGGVNLDDIISEVFGMGAGGGRHHRHRSTAEPGSDIRYDLSISLEDAFAGTTAKLSFRTYCACEKCGGSGQLSHDMDTCSACGGRGAFLRQQGFFTVEQVCITCGGSGRIARNPCTACEGMGRIMADKNLEVKIPKGVDSGTQIRLAGEGECGARGGERGDLYIIVSVTSHKLFNRDGKNLKCKVPISITTAALGKDINVSSIDKTPVTVKIPAGTQTGRQFCVKGKGMPGLRGNSLGDLLVEVVVETPVKLTKRQKEILLELEDSPGDITPMSSGFFAKVKEFFADK
ncbi:MAG: molecular chaperone DnaJ [Holosporales bacterium]|jgi:molecular chaperone DnaJ|nr:molecular chaperone DnaJ [Holosporales bacterium]